MSADDDDRTLRAEEEERAGEDASEPTVRERPERSRIGAAAGPAGPREWSEIAAGEGLSAILAGLAVICAAVSLFRAGTTTRAWARQLASATILAGILCVVLAVLTFVLMPTPVYPTP